MQVAPVVKSAVQAAAPVVEQGVKSAVEVAGPALQVRVLWRLTLGGSGSCCAVPAAKGKCR